MATRTVEKIKISNTLKVSTSYGTPQSFAYIDENNKLVICANSDIVRYSGFSSIKKVGKLSGISKGNGATYCNKNNTLYVVSYTSTSNAHTVVALDPTSFSKKFTIKLPSSVTGIAYDSVTTNFYVSAGNYFYIYPFSAFQKGGTYSGSYKKFNKQFINDSRLNNDIGAYNGIVYVTRAVASKTETNYIDCYKAADGKYVKSYSYIGGELESLVIDASGHLQLLFALDRKIVGTSNVLPSGSSTSVVTQKVVTPSLRDKFLQQLASIGKQMASNNFKYSQQSLKTTFSAALKSDHRTDCAHYISYAMQAVGLLPSGKNIWLNHKINGSGTSAIKKSTLVTITYPDKLWTQLNLCPGDIVGYGYTYKGVRGQHTQVYAGKDNKGQPLWYSAGVSNVKNKKYGPVANSAWAARKINVLIRIKDLTVNASTTSSVISTVVKTVSATENATKVIAKATSYEGQGGDTFWSYGGLAKGQPWCACFVWCIMSMVGLESCCYPKGTYYVDNCKNYMNSHSEFIKVYDSKDKNSSLTNAMPGDIIIFDFEPNGISNHIGFVKKTGTASTIYTIEGNTSTDAGIVASRTRQKREVEVIFRPPYGDTYTTNQTELGLQVNVNKLYSSSNYEYVSQPESTISNKITSVQDSLKSTFQKWMEDGFSPISDAILSTPTLLSGTLDTRKLTRTKVNGEVFGVTLPVALNPVEAPFVELTIGGYTFGTFDSAKYDRYPNYIDSLNVVRTNGSMNEYSIELVHQVRPGSNPNFIDELLSKNSYDKITIKYGDANSGVIFIDNNALLIGVQENFDFTNCNITYSIKATSSAISIAAHKRTFDSVTDRPSNVIRNLLYDDATGDLLNAFPRMRDRNFVETNNLIPSDDAVVEIEAFKNINAVTYVKNLVSSMKSVTDDIVKSTYMMTLEDGYFNITNISNSYNYDAQLYEVNINYPDENQVFSFSTDSNFYWPLAYEYGGSVSNYNYSISDIGTFIPYRDTSTNILDFSSQMARNITSNWWTQVTEFPTKATLNCRGLLSPLLLMTYIKINCNYFGSDRITSGVYVVTGQTDSLSKGGYRTSLSLLRVSNSKQHLTIDTRIRT